MRWRTLLVWLMSAALMQTGWATTAGGGPPIAHAAGATLYVASTGSDAGGNTCRSRVASCATLGYAIAQANVAGGDTVSIGFGTYSVAGNGTTANGDVIINRNLALQADATLPQQAGATTVTIDGHNSVSNRGRPVTVNAGVTAQITGLTITGGSIGGGDISGSGGGIANAGMLTLTNSTVTGNTAGINSQGTGTDPGNGGGIDNTGTLTVTGSTVSNNTAISFSAFIPFNGSGAGIANEANATLTVTGSTVSNNTTTGFQCVGGGIFNAPLGTTTVINSTLSGNSALFGAGIGNVADSFDPTILGTLTVINSTLSGNSTDGGASGGGLFNTGTATVTGTTLSGNSAIIGGGLVASFPGTLALVNSTVNGNSAPVGGGIWITDGGSMTMNNATVSGNTAPGGDPSSSFAAGILNDGSLTLADSLVVGNTLGGVEDDLEDDGCSCTPFDTTNIVGLTFGAATYTLGQIVAVDGHGVPLLTDHGGPTQTIALPPGSPAIDGGNPAGCDQRGFPRPFPPGGRCDIGAFEAQACGLVGTLASSTASAAVYATSAPTTLSQFLSLRSKNSRLLVRNPLVTACDKLSTPGLALTGTATVATGIFRPNDQVTLVVLLQQPAGTVAEIDVQDTSKPNLPVFKFLPPFPNLTLATS